MMMESDELQNGHILNSYIVLNLKDLSNIQIYMKFPLHQGP